MAHFVIEVLQRTNANVVGLLNELYDAKRDVDDALTMRNNKYYFTAAAGTHVMLLLNV